MNQQVDIHKLDTLTHTAHIPIGALPGALQINRDPYQIDSMRKMQRGLNKVAKYHERLATPFKIGISLACSNLHTTEQYPHTRRSYDPQQIGPLLNQKDAHFYNLQKDPFPIGANVLGNRWHELGAELYDFSDTAKWVNSMDVIITVDSVLAHVAGLLDKPTFLMLPFASDWRWQTNQRSSPWYSSIILYRQYRSGSWIEVAEDIAKDINFRRATLDLLPRCGQEWNVTRSITLTPCLINWKSGFMQ